MIVRKIYPVIALAIGVMACSAPKKEQEKEKSFEELGNQAEFKEKHDEPGQKAIIENGKGEMIDIPIDGAEGAKAYALLNEESNNYLLVFHEWWGLNGYVKEEADHWHEKLDGTNVIALDLYDGKVAEVRDSAQKYMQSADPERIQAIIQGALKMIPENARLGTIGWCFGGGWSLKGAMAASERAEACVMYYGMPINDPEVLGQLETDVLFIFAKEDKWINQEVADQFVKNMKIADKNLMVRSFDADHAFANPTQANFNEKAAEEANAISLQFLKDQLLATEEVE